MALSTPIPISATTTTSAWRAMWRMKTGSAAEVRDGEGGGGWERVGKGGEGWGRVGRMNRMRRRLECGWQGRKTKNEFQNESQSE